MKKMNGLPEPREKVSSPDVLNKETSLNTYPQSVDTLFIYGSRSHSLSELLIGDRFHPSDNYESSILGAWFLACLWWGASGEYAKVQRLLGLHVRREFYDENIFKSQKT